MINLLQPTYGIANKGLGGFQTSSPASILVQLDKLTSPKSLTGHTINRQTVH